MARKHLKCVRCGTPRSVVYADVEDWLEAPGGRICAACELDEVRGVPTASPRALRPARDRGCSRRCVIATLAVLVFVVAGLPELLGDRPYNVVVGDPRPGAVTG